MDGKAAVLSAPGKFRQGKCRGCIMHVQYYIASSCRFSFRHCHAAAYFNQDTLAD